MRRLLYISSLIILILLETYVPYAKIKINQGIKIDTGVKITGCFFVGGEVTLAWDANTEPDLVGYKLYYDINSGYPYSPAEEYQANEGASPITITVESLEDPDNPEYTLTGLTMGQLYYFVVTAYDTELEGDYSDELYCRAE